MKHGGLLIWTIWYSAVVCIIIMLF